jgi:hypothetical protein
MPAGVCLTQCVFWAVLKHAGRCRLTLFSSSLLASDLHPLLPHHSLLPSQPLRGPAFVSEAGFGDDAVGWVLSRVEAVLLAL